MRKSTLASVLILCGSTAAIANVSATAPQVVTNNTTVDNTTGPIVDSAPPAPDTTPTPAPTPDTTTNTQDPPTE
ncbi:hypothetical protein SAMN06297144_0799 [Sphingomonas guangdongensis]|uniref:Uncharacterized protein n=1 Tax=Sphingomonas guangdongensis TaxID=1141890 RepID=A0A285QD98_9SPHN|nr:hypothetical protein [Sphingomonas guangdongensis]SOB79920.1 hypothetical protein SAMN06297144_0799 [Sphingomonas guangdongensis]